MRTLILIALALSLHAAAIKAPIVEEFKLADGRTFVGTYDDQTEVLTLDAMAASLAVKESQIVSRSPAKALDVLEIPKDAPAQMTEEQKAARAVTVAAAQQDAARQRALAEADKADRDAAVYAQKAAARRDQARRDAAKFQARAHQEGAGHDITAILAGPISLQRTASTNAAILGLMADAKKYDGLAADRRKAAQGKRASAP